MRSASSAVVALALAVASLPAVAAGDPQAGKTKAATTCAQCHGADGNSTSPTFPILAGQHRDYIVKALEDYKSGARKNPIMTGMAANLTAQDREDLAAWFSSQKSPLTELPRRP